MTDYLDLRTAFYPCCGRDIETPLKLLHDFVDHVVFCDISSIAEEHHKKVIGRMPRKVPSSKFIVGSAHNVISMLQRIDVLFYRCDSGGEGGSDAIILGNQYLQFVLDRMPLEGGLIITDGSNSRQSNFEKMTRHNGLIKFGWHMGPLATTPTIRPPDGRSYSKDGLLQVVQVNPIIGEKGPPPHFDLRTIYF